MTEVEVDLTGEVVLNDKIGNVSLFFYPEATPAGVTESADTRHVTVYFYSKRRMWGLKCCLTEAEWLIFIVAKPSFPKQYYSKPRKDHDRKKQIRISSQTQISVFKDVMVLN